MRRAWMWGAGLSALSGAAALGLFSGPASAQGLPLVDPLRATPQTLLQRDFAYMQATKPGARPSQPGGPGNPGRPGGGNGGYQRPPGGYYPPTGGYYPPYNPGFGWRTGYGYYNGVYGYFSPSGVFLVLNNAPVVQQRDIIIFRDGQTGNPNMGNPNGGYQNGNGQLGNGQAGGAGGGEARPPQGRPAGDPETPRGGDGEFYLGKGAQSETISDALDDIRKAWLNGDHARLKARFKSSGQVRVYPKGQFKYAVPAQEFLDMVKDAMGRMDTVAFEFDRPRSETAGKAFVSGKHTFMDADKNRTETHISYGLERLDGKWYVTEAGSSSAPISRHE